jgi:hypothetical protein
VTMRQRLVRRVQARTRPSAWDGYNPDDIIDAPEHQEYARAMGLLTWGSWDVDVRPFEERLKDFLQAYPVDAPVRFQGSMLAKTSSGEYGPAAVGERLARIEGIDNSFGTLAEALARYGLKRRVGPQYVPGKIDVAPFREVTRVRNQRLRMLHGRVDIEADNMDEAKAAEIDRLEKKHAAEQVREVRERMRRELAEGG